MREGPRGTAGLRLAVQGWGCWPPRRRWCVPGGKDAGWHPARRPPGTVGWAMGREVAMRTDEEARLGHDGWTGLAKDAALVAGVAALVTGIAFRDREAVAIGGLLLAGVALLRLGGGGAGRVALAVLFVNNEAWMLPAAVSNMAHREGWRGVAVPLALVVSSATGLVALAVRHWRPHWAQHPGAAGVTAVAALAVFAVVGA